MQHHHPTAQKRILLPVSAGDAASSSDCSETYSASGVGVANPSAIPTWSQMPPLSLDAIVPPTPSTNTSNELNEVRDHLIGDDIEVLDIGDTFEGFHPIMEGQIDIPASIGISASCTSVIPREL